MSQNASLDPRPVTVATPMPIPAPGQPGQGSRAVPTDVKAVVGQAKNTAYQIRDISQQLPLDDIRSDNRDVDRAVSTLFHTVRRAVATFQADIDAALSAPQEGRRQT